MDKILLVNNIADDKIHIALDNLFSACNMLVMIMFHSRHAEETLKGVKLFLSFFEDSKTHGY